MTMGANNLQAVSSFRGESLMFPMLAEDGHFEMHRPTEAVETQAVISQPHADEQLTSIVNPEVILPGAIVAGVTTAFMAAYFLGRKLQKSEATAERTLSHDGRALILDRVFANVKVEADPEIEGIEITVRGKTKRLDALHFVPKADGLQITPDRSCVQLDISPGWLAWMVKLISRPLKIEVLDKSDKVDLRARVPEGSSLTLNQVSGPVSAKGTYGKTSIDVSYSQKVDVESASETDVKAASDSRVRIGSIDGPAKVRATYSSSVVVDGGEVPSLDARLDSASTLQFGAAVGNLQLVGTYGSSARIKKASGKVYIKLDSDSKATVDGGQARDVTIKAVYNSRGVFKGDTDQATLKLDSDSYAQLGSVGKRLAAELSYNSDARVMQHDVWEIDADLVSSCRLFIDNGVVRGGTINLRHDSKAFARQFDPAVHLTVDSSSRAYEKH